MPEIECPGKRNFLGLSDAFSTEAASYFHIIPVPYDATSTYVAGSRNGPRAILDASANIEIYDQDLDMEAAQAGVATHTDVQVSVGDPLLTVAEVERQVERVLSLNALPVVLGGEHTVSLGAIRALARRGDLAVVSLDAHADLRDRYQGSQYSHACFLRRALESAAGWLFGVRSMSAGEARYAKQAGVKMVSADAMLRAGMAGVDLDFLPRDIYLSIDLDVLDPSIMPATGTPEPGGLGWYDITDFLKRVVEGRRILGFDVVELCPLPGNAAPDFTAAKLVYRVMGFILKFSDNRSEDRVCYGEEKTEGERAG